MCQSCNCFFCGIAAALDNLFSSPANGNGCGCNNNHSGCGCNNVNPLTNAVNNLFGNGGSGCGCNGDAYYAQQYALGPYATGCNVCGF